MSNKIEILNLKFRNLFSYGNKWSEIDFKRGLSFITGYNVQGGRRNFCGKSSFLKVIPFALFGKIEGINKNQIINWKNKKKAESIITIKKNKDIYVIHRSLKPDTFKISKNDIEMPMSSNKKTFQEEFEENILKIDFNNFMNICYCDANNIYSILNASKPIKRDYLEKLFDLSYFSIIKDKSNKKKQNLTNNLNDLTNNSNIVDKELEILSDENKKYNDLVDDLVDITIPDEIDNTKTETKLTNFRDLEKQRLKDNIVKEKINSKIFLCKKIKSSTDLTVDEAAKKLKFTINSIIPEGIENDVIETKLNEVRLLEKQRLKDNIVKEKINSKIFLCKKIKSSTDLTVDETAKKLDIIKKLEDKGIISKNEKLKNEILSIEKDISIKKISIDPIEKEIKKLKKELNNKPKKGKCLVCFNEVDFNKIKVHYDKLLKEKNDYSETLLNDIKSLEIKLKSKSKSKSKLENDLSKIDNKDKLENDLISVKKFNKYQKVLHKLLEILRNYGDEEYGHIIEEYELQIKENIEKENRRKELIQKRKELILKLENDLVSVKKYNKYKKVINRLEDSLLLFSKSDYSKDINTLEKQLENNKIKNDKRNIEIEKQKGVSKNRKLFNSFIKKTDIKKKVVEKNKDKIKKELKNSNNILDYLNEIINICDDKKVKQFAIQNSMPYLNEKVNFYLRKSEVKFYIKLDKWLELDIKGLGISNAVYNNLSGAERLCLDFAFRFACIDILNNNSMNIDLLVFDEVLDGSLDNEGLEKLMQMVKTKTNEDSLKTLIVSHKNELGSLDEYFNYKYIIEFDEFSVMKEEK